MLELIVALGALAAGAALGWLAARGHFLAVARAEREAFQGRIAAAESLQDDARKQMTERELRISELVAQVEVERTERARGEERWAGERKNLEEQRRLLDEARERLADTFKALSADALNQSAGLFLERARETLEGQLGRREQVIEGLVRPLQDALRRAEEQTRELEKTRQHAYGSLEEQLRALADQSRQLQRETGTLASALRSSQARGRWGEIALRRVVELAGLTEHSDFVEQVTVEDGDGGRLRPDMVIQLPAGRQIIIDSKVPLAAYLEAMAATAPEARQEALARHARDLRSHVAQLAGKAYWKQFPQSPDLVVLFIPGESFVAAAAEADPELLADAMERRIVVASPATLFALLAAVAYGWQQQLVARSAEEIRKLGQDLYERLATLGSHFRNVGQALGKAVEAYNDAVGSMERRVLPAARRFRDLGAGAREEIPVLDPIDQDPRRLTASELAVQLELDRDSHDEGASGPAASDRTTDAGP